jgi:outer membrane protein TolC
LIQARNNYRISLLQLAKTLGYETRALGANQEPFRLIGGLMPPPVCIGLAEALQQARERRPSLKAQRQNILIEVEDIVVQQAGYKPTVQANAGYVIQNDRFSKSLGDVVHGWFFGVQGNWNVFDGFETYGKVKQARARLEEAHINYQDSVAQVDLEVQQAWANLDQAWQTVISQLQTVAQAEEAVRLARERLAAGAGTQLDLLNATVALTQAQVTTLQAKYNTISSLAEFDRATGSATRYSETFQDPLVKRKRPVWKEKMKTAR